MKKQLCGLFLILVFFTVSAAAQTLVRGKATREDDGLPIPGVNISVKSTKTGTLTDANGLFELQLEPGSYTLEATSIGYKTTSVTIEVGRTPVESAIGFVMPIDAVELQELVILGSRSSKSRTNIDKPVPVDIISQKEIKLYGQNDVTQSLNYVAPSFNANRQTGANGTDHIDPASLRGLGPDQVLVMVNGKRRHTTALVNINGSFGRGTVGTDMNAIPMAAVERIEILRDGAAAQYGSDAIAGVINLVLKKKSPLIVSTTYGQCYSSFLDKTYADGKNIQFDFTKGFSLGSKGVINVSAQYLNRQYTNRSGDDTRPLLYSATPTKKPSEKEEDYQARYAQIKKDDNAQAQANGLSRHNARIGNADIENKGVFVNGEYALTPNLSAYATAGFSHKKGRAAGAYRLPILSSQVDLTIYPNGFLPLINTSITDLSAITGLRGELDKWSFDVSNTFGSNLIGFRVTNTLNASLPPKSSPTEFEAGKLTFFQNTFNFDLSRRLTFDKPLTALNLAFGTEFRNDTYIVTEGEELSWSFGQRSKNIAGVPDKQAGSQSFQGFRPSNALNKSRNNVALYADFEQEFGPQLLTEVAGRFERYSDFGSNFSGKASARWKVFQDISLRGAFATGFRAPSLHQRYFNSENVLFLNTVPARILTANNDNPVVGQFGVGNLKPEISTSYSVGITGKLFHKLVFTIDAYQIDIRDRIVFSSSFRRERDTNGNLVSTGRVNTILNSIDPEGSINAVQFFTNAVNSRTRGLDVVISDKYKMGKGELTATIATNFQKTEVTSVNPPEAISANATLTQKLFSRQERARYEMGTPRSKINLALSYTISNYTLMLRTVRFGKVGNRYPDDPATSGAVLPPQIDQDFSAKWITDLVLSYRVIKNLDFTIGANNLFDIYPDKIYIDPRNNQDNLASPANEGYTTDRDTSNNGCYIYSRDAMQFGFNGRYIYGKLTFTLSQKVH